MSHHQRRIFDMLFPRKCAGICEELSDENRADGNRILDRAHFRQSGICIRYAALLHVHDLEAGAITRTVEAIGRSQAL